MENGLISTTAAADRCVTMRIILLCTAEERVNETILIPERTPVDAAAAAAAANTRL